MKDKIAPLQTSDEPFKLIEKPEFFQLLQILKNRLPISGQVYNMALILEKFPDEMQAYSLYSLSDDSIIMIIFQREDYGQDINISLPSSFQQPTSEIQQAFTSTKVIDWPGSHLFTAADRRISKMLFEISTIVYRNSVIFNPNYSVAMDLEDALKIQIDTTSKTGTPFEARPLDVDSGVEFLMKTWRYARAGAEPYLKKIIKGHISSGIYVKGELVCAAVINGHGLVGILNTAKEHQCQGFGTQCLKHILRQMAQNGFIPVSTLQQENTLSMKLHEKLGMKTSHESDYIFHIPYLKNY